MMKEKESTIELVRKRRKEIYSNKTPQEIVQEAIEWEKQNPQKIFKRSLDLQRVGDN